MIKVWVVWWDERWCDDGFIGIYSTEEKARQACHDHNFSESHIEAIELDKSK